MYNIFLSHVTIFSIIYLFYSPRKGPAIIYWTHEYEIGNKLILFIDM